MEPARSGQLQEWPLRAFAWLTASSRSFVLARCVFLRALALVYLAAFASFGWQIKGLIGARGIVPAAESLAPVAERLGRWTAFAQWPSVFWFGASDAALVAACVAGVVLALVVLAGLVPRWALLGCWALYLSLVNAGNVFMSFQWDLLLLEAGLLAVLLAPGGWWPERRGLRGPPRWALLLLWFLLFKLMVLSGLVKLLSGDPAWRDLSALEYHYWTQPLPTWTSAWVDRLPASLHRVSTAVMLLIELVVPLTIWGPVKVRRVGAVLLIGLQLLILLTGNYGFFNYLTIALALLLIDDAWWRRLLPGRAVRWLERGADRAQPEPPLASPRRIVGAIVAGVLAVASLAAMLQGMGAGEPPGSGLLSRLDPLRSVNGYGLFAVMTTTRPEIVVEGSADGVHWQAYEFPWKPTSVSRVPGFVAPHQPRLDWQMWFAALGSCARNEWFLRFQWRLLQAEPAVLALLERDPFEGRPPRYVRSTLWQYRFAAPGERAESGAFWTRTWERPYCPVLMLQEGRLMAAPRDVGAAPPEEDAP